MCTHSMGRLAPVEPSLAMPCVSQCIGVGTLQYQLAHQLSDHCYTSYNELTAQRVHQDMLHASSGCEHLAILNLHHFALALCVTAHGVLQH